MTITNKSVRRHDIDWIRVIAIGLLLIYHGTISFQPWGNSLMFITNQDSLEALWIPMSLLNVWRIPILFFISGMGVFFAIRKRNWKALMKERTRRILVPLIFGFFAIVPIHVFIYQKYYNQTLFYAPDFSHLWFLANIYVYTFLLSPLFFYFRKKPENNFFKFSLNALSKPIGIYLFIIPFIVEAILIQPAIFSLYLFSAHGFWLGILAFFFGFCFVAFGDVFWNNLAKLKYVNLGVAFLLYLVRLILFGMEGPAFITAIESTLWIFSILGLGYSFLNFDNKWIAYFSKAAYPIYIIHMAFQYLSNYFIFPLNINPIIKYAIVILMTFAGSILFYEVFINRIKFIRPLFGLNYKEKST
jgi:peptidoglycan/LPS O-acetylase OafA/YrhL